MRAFSYAWSLQVTSQRRRSHHLILHSRKPMLHGNKCHDFIFCRTGVMRDPSFITAGIGILDFFAPVTMTLTCRPSYTNLTRIPWIYTGCANMNVLRQGFRKLSSDRQTDRQTDTTKNHITHRFAGG